LLFRFTRLAALFLIFALTIAIVVIGLIAGKRASNSTHVSPAEVLDTSAKQTGSSVPSNQSDQQQLGVSLPANLWQLVNSADNLAALKQRMTGLNLSERKEYLNNLSEVVAQAQLQHADVISAVNRYFELKSQKLAERPSETERMLVPLYAGAAIFGLVLLIALLSLVLVLLAIERNTRWEQKKSMVAAASPSFGSI
jgi:hypothetical protein